MPQDFFADGCDSNAAVGAFKANEYGKRLVAFSQAWESLGVYRTTGIVEGDGNRVGGKILTFAQGVEHTAQRPGAVQKPSATHWSVPACLH